MYQKRRNLSFSKLPIRQITSPHEISRFVEFSKLPIRQITQDPSLKLGFDDF